MTWHGGNAFFLYLHANCLLSGGKEAGWASDRNGCVGDQRRQRARSVLISVLTAAEGVGLTRFERF